MDEKGKKTDLNILLLKTGLSDQSQFLKKAGDLRSEEIKIGKEQIGTLVFRKAHANPPRWAAFFSGVVETEQFGKNSSTGALLAVEVENRIFLLTFGQGRHLINSEYIETNFGLMVTLNCVDPNSLRSIDKSTLEAHPRQSREQSGQATELQYFGVDVERDLLRAVTGVPTDASYGERISGMDALKLTVDVDLSSLKGLLSKVLKMYKDDSYKTKGFAFVDHIGEVKDRALSQTLDLKLISNIKLSHLEKIWLAVPEIIDWDRVVGFKYSMSAKSGRVYDVSIQEFVETLGDKELDKHTLMTKKIYCVDADDAPVLDRPAYHFIYAELNHDGETYLLSNGTWYRVDHDFVSQVNKYYENVTKYKKALPIYDDETEAEYNKRVAAQDKAEFVLLDKQNVYLPGRVSPVEPCDLYRWPREFIHVKRYGGSSLLSHLFNQGFVSGELFKMDRVYRKLLDKKLPKSHEIANVDAEPRPKEYKIVYAIVSEYGEELSLPFFSKISLRHVATRLMAMGFDVEIAKIGVSETKKKTKKIQPTHNKIKKSSKLH